MATQETGNSLEVHSVVIGQSAHSFGVSCHWSVVSRREHRKNCDHREKALANWLIGTLANPIITSADWLIS